MNILIIAPLTPPYTGNALPIKLIYDHYNLNHTIKIANLNKESYKPGINSFKRIFEISKVFLKIIFNFRKCDLIYLTIAESFAGNLRDLVIYAITFPKRKKTIIHMLGGAAMKNILTTKKSIIFQLNKFFISRIGNVIVEGQMQANFFANVTTTEHIRIIPNFAQDFLFTNLKEIELNFNKAIPLKILFLSNMIEGKGYMELLNAFLQLNEFEKGQISIDFAGKFESLDDKNKFLYLLSPYSQLKYHGQVNGKEKIDLFGNAHIFCLPTYYQFEGQPFVIIEAYASGCVVITTNHSGIDQIFRNNINGFEVKKTSIDSLKEAIRFSLKQKTNLSNIAKHNLEYSLENFTEMTYLKNIDNVTNLYLK